MKDIPMFTTDYGVASLILKEVPYRRIAYVRVLDVQPGQLREHLAECVGFCRMVDSERVYATGHEELENWPLHNVILNMSLSLPELPRPEAHLFPVTDETVARWRQIYNEGMKNVDNASTLASWDEKQIVASGGAYFVHNSGELLGIGWMKGSQLLAIVSVKPGMGETVARTLFTVADSDRITLEVASTNKRALRLYERMGFLVTGERSRWYKIR